MSPEKSAREINNVLAGLPLLDRTAALAVSIVHDEPNAAEAIRCLIEFATIMSRHLPIDQQTAVVWHLRAAVAELETRWN